MSVSQATKTVKTRQLAKAQLATLKAAAAAGQIELKFLDETGCCLWSPVSYTYRLRETPMKQEQTARRGQRVSILGVWDKDNSFDYTVVVGGFDGERYIEFMDWLASKATLTFEQTGRLTVVVQDNCSIHTSGKVKQRWTQWRKQGVNPAFSTALLLRVETH